MHPLRKTFDLYHDNLVELASALTEAGGAANVVLGTEAFREILTVLAANNIAINPKYLEASNGR